MNRASINYSLPPRASVHPYSCAGDRVVDMSSSLDIRGTFDSVTSVLFLLLFLESPDRLKEFTWR